MSYDIQSIYGFSAQKMYEITCKEITSIQSSFLQAPPVTSQCLYSSFLANNLAANSGKALTGLLTSKMTGF